MTRALADVTFLQTLQLMSYLASPAAQYAHLRSLPVPLHNPHQHSEFVLRNQIKKKALAMTVQEKKR
jgi:hypothetical protein